MTLITKNIVTLTIRRLRARDENYQPRLSSQNIENFQIFCENTEIKIPLKDSSAQSEERQNSVKKARKLVVSNNFLWQLSVSNYNIKCSETKQRDIYGGGRFFFVKEIK